MCVDLAQCHLTYHSQFTILYKKMPLSPGSRRARVSLSEHAYNVIRERILKGEIPLGAALSRRKLAKELGMSLLPVAEALQQLESDNLVESRPRVGTRVCLPTAEEIRERYEIREALESQAARLFAEKANLSEKLELKKMAEHMDAMFNRCAAGVDNDREFLYAVHNYHLQFHLRIAECTGCKALQQTIEKNHVLIFNWLFDVSESQPQLPPRFHRDLIEALNEGDVEKADRAMRAHIRYGIEAIVTKLGPRASSRFERVK